MRYVNKNYHCIFTVCLFWFAGLTSATAAEIVELQLDNGHVVSAEYSQGEANAPSILIMHGFLQTREFHTVKRVFDALAEAGYNVLAPTLSLGLSHRKKSLACEAIHAHSMQTDIAEIDIWTRWLKDETGKNIILLGHSAGSMQLVAYLSNYKQSPVDQVIYISLVHFGQGIAAKENPVDYKRATSAIKKASVEIDKYGLSYCAEYPTTPQNYISYYEWSKEKIITELKNIKIPSHVIFGSMDMRIDKNWIEKVKSSGIKVELIKGANHFFVSEHEFDLQDAIDKILPGI